MKTIRRVEIKEVAYVKYMPPHTEMEQDVVYISKEFLISIHKCLCGCGEQVVLPINSESGWQLLEHSDGRISFTPSIGNFRYKCKSHYIITNNIANFV